ncbi:MAG: DUF4112 domain-containing protein [Candidatus Parcubacteria bacterium]|nr:DUF4112 domain-containing protein [Burkholderiales bacterium]
MPDNRRRERLSRLAWLLDSSIPIPGTRLTVGLEALLGLMPVAGDLVGVLLSSYIIKEAHALGVSRAILARMAFNVAVEGVVGMVPFAGDLFDAGWKANQRNVRLLDRWMEHPDKARKGSRLFVAGLALALFAFAAACAALAWLLLGWLSGLAA